MMLNTILIVLTTTFSLALILFLLGRYIYKRSHNMPTGDCAYCKVGVNKLLKQYRKKYAHK